ncbi:MAG: FtsB family cell division protein [Candidatus Acidiferrales bacterium]
MDSRVKRNNQEEVATDTTQLGFFEQLREFVRRNVTWFLVAGLALLILQDVLGTHGVLAMHHSMKQSSEIQNEIQQLNQQNQELQKHVQALKSDPAAIERIAREDMGLARPGEYIFKIQPKPGAPTTPLAQPAEPPRKK